MSRHRYPIEMLQTPPEHKLIAQLQAEKMYRGWEAIEEAKVSGLLRDKTRHAELSPTFRCPEDCVGCPDRASLHAGDPPEKQIRESEWYEIIDRMVDLGVEYFLLIGGAIDGHPVTPRLMSYILSKDAPVDGGWFTDGIMLQNWKTGELNTLFHKLNKQGHLLQLTTHVSADYLVKEGTNTEGPILNHSTRLDNEYDGSCYYKSAFGERLARTLVTLNAKRVVINTTISAYNLDEVIAVYNYIAELQEYARTTGSQTVVLHTLSPWVWRPHLARGDNQRNYDTAKLLSEKHVPIMKKISEYILNDTYKRMKTGNTRVAANSSSYIAGLPDFGTKQDTPYHQGSGIFAALPDGTIRIDPVFVSVKMLEYARNPYGYRDRDIDVNPFEKYNKCSQVTSFPNLIQTTRGDIAWY